MKKSGFLYRLSDGSFTGVELSGDHQFIFANTPPECGFIEGHYDVYSQKVDLKSDFHKDVVDCQPPRPDADHEWIHDDAQGNRVRQWRKKPEVIERERAIASAKAAISELEAKQPRAEREARLYADSTRLQEIERQVLAQRQIIHEAETR